MPESYGRLIERLRNNPELMLMKRPFTRGVERSREIGQLVGVGENTRAELPDFRKEVISQQKFLEELDPHSHEVLTDENIPSVSVKDNAGSYYELKYKRLALPMQSMIVNKQTLHLCGNRTVFTISDENPTDTQKSDFAAFKRMWVARNMDGMFERMVYAQKSCGDAGLLFYHDYEGRTKCRLISYADGYVICSHNDDNGDRAMECIYYAQNGVEHIDCYDRTMHYSYVRGGNGNTEWTMDSAPSPHGFPEIPLVTKRGYVAWDNVQGLIEFYEIMYNIFLVIQKRHGWGMLYIKGNFDKMSKKVAGSIILNDRSLEKDGDAKYLAPPSPDGMIETLKGIFEQIQIGSGTTIILPKDISMGGDVSGVAVQIAQSLDNETANKAAIDWQNVISKMTRLFQYGIAKERVNSGEDLTAVTRYSELSINAAKKPWRPRSDSEYNQMLKSLAEGTNPILSRKTAIEKNTESAPDEEIRIAAEQAALATATVEE